MQEKSILVNDKAENENEATTPMSDEFTPPEYTMKDILAAIPPHCHQRNTLLSIGYV